MEKENQVQVVEAEEAVETTGNVLQLKKPTLINGEMVSEIAYDLDSIGGKEVQLAMRELNKRKLQVMVAELDTNYHAMLFAISAGLSFEDVSALGLKDYQAMCSLVRDFFLAE